MEVGAGESTTFFVSRGGSEHFRGSSFTGRGSQNNNLSRFGGSDNSSNANGKKNQSCSFFTFEQIQQRNAKITKLKKQTWCGSYGKIGHRHLECSKPQQDQRNQRSNKGAIS